MMQSIDIQISAKKCRWSAAKDAFIIYDSDMSFSCEISYNRRNIKARIENPCFDFYYLLGR